MKRDRHWFRYHHVAFALAMVGGAVGIILGVPGPSAD